MPRERRAESLFESKSVRENFGIATLGRDTARGLLSPKRTKQRLGEYVDRLKIKLGDPDDAITTLSGGNQQKVVMARWLATEPKVLLLNDPTRGVDIGAKRDLYDLLLDLAGKGVAIVMLSTEVDEHVELMDRVLVFRDGRDQQGTGARRAVAPVDRGSVLWLSSFAGGPGCSPQRSPLGLLIANIVAEPNFGKPGNWPAELATLAPFAIVALASTPSILSGGGGLDISIGPIAVLANVVMIEWFLPHSGLDSAWVGIPLLMLIGAAIGAINGTLVAVFRYQPVIATLCTFFVLAGVIQKIAPSPKRPRRGQLDGRLRRQGRPRPGCADPDRDPAGDLVRAVAHGVSPQPLRDRRQRRHRVQRGRQRHRHARDRRTRSAVPSPRSPVSR